MSSRLEKIVRVAIALTLTVLLSAVPALAGLTIIGGNGITASGADGINFWNTSGITASGADGVLAFSPNGITASGADGITASGADGITASGADGITASGADGITISGADSLTAVSQPNGITISGADGQTYQADSIVVRNPTGITASGADNVIATGTNGITASGADTRNIAHADGITASGADGITASGADTVVTVNGASSIVATSPTGVVFSVTPNAITITGVSGITASGADGITISGADEFVLTGVGALTSALSAVGVSTGLVSVDPELAVLLNAATDDSSVNAVITYRSMPTDGDIADLQQIGVLGGTRYHSLPMISVTTTKRRLIAISHLPHVRSIYGNRTLQWNLEVATRNTIGSDRIRRSGELTTANHGTPVTGRGVTVAVLDTGVDGTHSDLSGRVVQNVKLVDTQSVGAGFNYPVASANLPDTDQVYGHGTFVAGVIAGNGQQSAGKYAGVASGANILGLSAGDATLLFVLSGLDYLLTNAQAFNVRVVNCSFSANTVFDFNDPVNIATRMLTDAGVNVVFSAGNTGSGADSLNPYSVAPWVISVGATDNVGHLADFSSRGEFGSPLFHPTVVAPGVNTVSLRPSTLVSVTTASGLPADQSQLSATELPFYTTASGTSFSAPQVAGVIALMLEANPQLTPAQVRDILQRTASPLPAYYLYEVGAGMLNAHAAVLEAAFPQRHFGSWRGVAFQNQVQFTPSSPQTFMGSVASGASSDSGLTLPANTVRASLQIAWGLTSVNRLSLALLDPNGVQQTIANAKPASGLTGRRQRTSVDLPAAGAWTARVTNVADSTLSLGEFNTLNGTGGTNTTNGGTSTQSFYGYFETVTAGYPSMSDLSSLDASSLNEVNQSFRSLVMAPIGARFRPGFAVTRADLAGAMVLGGRVPQYFPAASNYPDVRDKATMLFVESAQASPGGSLFPSIAAGTNFQPDASVDRLTAVVALVRAAGLKQQAESGSYTLPYTDTLSIPASLRGYVALAVQNGLIKANGATFNPSGAFTRLDLAHAMSRLAGMPLQ
jgi:serine protease AprX